MRNEANIRPGHGAGGAPVVQRRGTLAPYGDREGKEASFNHQFLGEAWNGGDGRCVRSVEADPVPLEGEPEEGTRTCRWPQREIDCTRESPETGVSSRLPREGGRAPESS